MSTEYPYIILDADGRMIDCAGNVESAVSVLYGDLSDHDGRARVVKVPAGDQSAFDRLTYHAEINADCWDIPLDRVEFDPGRCGECGHVGSHGLVHVRHPQGGGGVNRPCSQGGDAHV